MTMLRQGLLDGRAIALAGGVPPAIGGALRELGARVEVLDAALGPGPELDATLGPGLDLDATLGPGPDLGAALGPGPELDEDAAAAWVQSAAPLHALVYEAAPAFGAGGQDGLRDCIERAWIAVRTLATAALIPVGAGKVVLIAPHPDAGAFAAAARAALENLARTLSVEWARYGIGVVAIAPAATTGEGELAELVCFLVSPAGEYFTGCVFELGAATGAR